MTNINILHKSWTFDHLSELFNEEEMDGDEDFMYGEEAADGGAQTQVAETEKELYAISFILELVSVGNTGRPL